MKLQALLSILPFLVGLTVAIPAAEPLPASAISTISLRSTSLHNGTLPTPTPLSDEGDDEGDDVLLPGNDDGEPLLEDEGATSDVDESLPVSDEQAIKRAIPTKLGWISNPNIKFRVGRNINVEVKLTLRSNGIGSFFTRVNNRRRWGPYRYTVVCGLMDKAGKLYTFDHKGRVCRRARACHVDVKDETFFSNTIKGNWENIIKGDKKLSCKARASWNLGGVIHQVIEWFKRQRKVAVAVIAIIRNGERVA